MCTHVHGRRPWPVQLTKFQAVRSAAPTPRHRSLASEPCLSLVPSLAHAAARHAPQARLQQTPQTTAHAHLVPQATLLHVLPLARHLLAPVPPVPPQHLGRRPVARGRSDNDLRDHACTRPAGTPRLPGRPVLPPVPAARPKAGKPPRRGGAGGGPLTCTLRKQIGEISPAVKILGVSIRVRY